MSFFLYVYKLHENEQNCNEKEREREREREREVGPSRQGRGPTAILISSHWAVTTTAPPADKEIPNWKTRKKPNAHVKVTPLSLSLYYVIYSIYRLREREREIRDYRDRSIKSNPTVPIKSFPLCTPNYVQTKISLPQSVVYYSF